MLGIDLSEGSLETDVMGSPDELPISAEPDRFELPPGFFERSDEERRQWIWDLRGGQPTGLTAREKILWTVDSTRDPRAIPALIEILERDGSVPVQRAALLALGGTKDPAAIPGLMIGLRSDDGACCLSAILGCQDLRAREAVPDLIALLANTQRKDFRQLREHAAEALVAIRDERAIEPLRAVAKHGGLRSRRRLQRLADELASSVGY
jgi:HEAT repeat protein